MMMELESKAFEAAKREGLKFFRATSMGGGNLFRFVASSWADAGFETDADGSPVRDRRGNNITSFSSEELDRKNIQHLAELDEWYGY